MKIPEFILLGGAFRGMRGGHGILMYHRKGIVLIDEADLPFIGFQQLMDRRLNGSAHGALEVRKFDNGKRGRRIALLPEAGVARSSPQVVFLTIWTATSGAASNNVMARNLRKLIADIKSNHGCKKKLEMLINQRKTK